ncbi:hypothetical protein AAY473_017141 [Plecturocebus cupreus]
MALNSQKIAFFLHSNPSLISALNATHPNFSFSPFHPLLLTLLVTQNPPCPSTFLSCLLPTCLNQTPIQVLTPSPEPPSSSFAQNLPPYAPPVTSPTHTQSSLQFSPAVNSSTFAQQFPLEPTA